jgi:ABC-type proline/glycine betaine transport system permease subunit
MDDAFTFIGNAFGEFIRFIVDGLTGFFNGIDDAAGSFMQGLSDSLGIPITVISLLVLVLGLWLLWKGVAALMRTALVTMLIWWLLGVTVLSWLIN